MANGYAISNGVESTRLMATLNNLKTGLEVDEALLENKVRTLNLHRKRWDHSGSTFTFSVRVLSASEYQAQKPSDAFPFDAGYIGSGGAINISEPTTNEQKAVFKDINQVALYYLCQAYIRYYYSNNPIPMWLSNGFAAYEAHLDIPDATIKVALNSYGGSISSFDILNDRDSYIAKNGLALSYMFGEFMSAFHVWHYYYIENTTAQSIGVSQYWWSTETVEKLLAKWNRYLSHRILEPNENLRIKKQMETDHFVYYYRDADNFNYPLFSNTVEAAYDEYTAELTVQAYEKMTFYSIPECLSAEIDGTECLNRITSGTAWSSGVSLSCANSPNMLNEYYMKNRFVHLVRHEFAHTMQGLIGQGDVTSWMNEGFAEFFSRGGFSDQEIDLSRDILKSAMEGAFNKYGHRPTYDETREYSTYDYYLLGRYYMDFIYRRGKGYATIKEVCQNDVEGYKKMGFQTPDDFHNAFYFDFDIRIYQKSIVNLTTPTIGEQVNEKNIILQWIPLDPKVKLDVFVSTDNQVNWTPLASATTATRASWTAPDGFTGQFYLKFNHADYMIGTIFGPYTKGVDNTLSLQYPKGGEILLAGDSVSIQWASTSIPSIRIDFSSDNGTTWSEVKTDVPTNKRYLRWLVPSTLSSSCKIRLTDMANSATTSESQNSFRITEGNTIGGPYLVDDNTVLLMHFDGDLTNQSTLSGNGTGDSGGITYQNSQNDKLGQCVKTSLPISVAHSNNLNLTGDWTIEAWVKIESFTTENYQLIITKPGDNDAYESNYSLLINPWWDNVFHYFYYSKTNSRIGTTATKPTLNEWYHVACTRDTKKSEVRIVVRDKNLNVVSNNKQSYTTGNDMYVNSKDLLIGQNFNGYIDELRISRVVREFEKPTAPSSPNPHNNASGVNPNTSVNLTWINGQRTERVDLYLGTTNPPTTKVVDNAIGTNSYAASNLSLSTTYYWRVVCRNAGGATEGPIWSFITSSSTGIDRPGDVFDAFTIYPNPSNGDFIISINRPLSGNATAKIFDSMGRVVYSKNLDMANSNEQITTSLSQGIYLLQILDGDFTATKKILVRE